MGRICMLSFTLLALLFHGCLGRQFGLKSPNACRLDQLNTLEPNRRVRYEAGEVEFWNHNAPQLQCAGVTVFRLTIKPNGIRLPLYRSSPSLGYVFSGQGIRGVVIPGCAETYLDSQSILQQQGQQQSQQGKEQQSQQGKEQQGEEEQGQQQQQSQQGKEQQSQQGPQWGEHEQFPDMHQKVERLKEGDVIALQEGVTEWFFNDGKSPLVIVVLADLSSVDNQLDRNLRTFLLAGNNAQQQAQQGHQGQEGQQGQEGHQGQEGQQGQEGHQGQEGEQGQQSQNRKNVFNGFGDRIIAESFKINVQTVKKLKKQDDKRGNIVFAKKRFHVIIPPTQRQQNGLEETVCSLRLQENIDNPSRADVYAPDAGRISTINSHTLPVLRQIQLSAVRGVLYSRGIYLPHWNLNANAIIYATGGQARVQVVDDNGNSVFDGQLQKGQLLVVPQGFAVVTRAKQNGFEFITFKTNDNAIIQTLAGRTSAVKGLPEQVLEIAYQISPREAKEVKYNTIATTLTKAKLGPQEYDEE